jgi:hypothetical protein
MEFFKFEVCLGYIVRSFLKTKQINKKGFYDSFFFTNTKVFRRINSSGRKSVLYI